MSEMLSAIQLVKGKPAGDLTADEADLVRRMAAASPALAVAVGGQEALAAYLSDLPGGSNDSLPGRLVESVPADPRQATDSPPGFRWSGATIAAAALLAAFAGLLYFRGSGQQQPARILTRQDKPRAADASPQAEDSRGDDPNASKDGASRPRHRDSTSGGAAKGGHQSQHPPAEATAAKLSAPAEKPPTKAGSAKDKPEDPKWSGWDIRPSEDCLVLTQTDWDLANPLTPVPIAYLLTTNGEVKLSKNVHIAGEELWLQLRLLQPEGKPLTGRFRVTVGQKSVELPPSSSDESRVDWLVSLAKHAGHTVPIEITFQSASDNLPIRWESLTVGQVRPKSLDLVVRADNPSGLAVARLRISPWLIFEDDPNEVQRRSARLPPLPTASEAYSGTQSLVLPVEGSAIVISSKPTAIRSVPSDGEYRYLRMAMRKNGEGPVQVVLRRRDGTAVRTYIAGQRLPMDNAKASMWPWPVPDEWIVLDSDLVKDFGEFEFDEIAVQTTGGGQALVDHVYLAARSEDFAKVKAKPRDSQSRSHLVELAITQPQVYGAMRAMVSVEVAGRSGGGVIIDPSGLLLTTAYVACAPKRNVKVVLFDGKLVAGTVLGVHRDMDVALIRIDGQGPFEHAELSGGWPGGEMHAAAPIGSWEKGRNMVTGPAGMMGAMGGFAWTNILIDLSHSGGVLISSTGQIVGLNSRPSPFGGGLHVPGASLKQCLEPLLAGKEFGVWSEDMVPSLGVEMQERDGQFFVAEPAEAAGDLPRKGDRLISFNGSAVKSLAALTAELSKKNPGDMAVVELARGDTTLKVDVPLRHPE